jgi:hypothetical protein
MIHVTAACDLVLHGIVSQSNWPSIINGVRFYDCCSNINCRLSRSKKASYVLSYIENASKRKKSQIFNKDECKYLFLPFQLKNKACRFHSFIRMSMSCLLHHKDSCVWPCLTWHWQPIKSAEYNQWSPLLRLL